jgi:hypothetical protein
LQPALKAHGNNRQLPFLHNRFFVDWPRGGSLRLGVTEGGGFLQRKGA